MKHTIITVVSLLVVLGFVMFGIYVSIYDKDVNYRASIEAKQENCTNYMDKMWKILQEQAGVTESFKESFGDIYTGIMEGRYSGNNRGSLMLQIQESNPDFSPALFEKLMQTIEVQREGFYRQQQELIAHKSEHDKFLGGFFVSKVFLSGAEKVKITVITSSESKMAAESGVDDRTLQF